MADPYRIATGLIVPKGRQEIVVHGIHDGEVLYARFRGAKLAGRFRMPKADFRKALNRAIKDGATLKGKRNG